jgi:hypothetical protein
MDFYNTQTFEWHQVWELMTLMILEMKENGGSVKFGNKGSSDVV